ncbi:MAG TPA: PilZ domain-containing protein [Desulfuromonadaceae bacterium]
MVNPAKANMRILCEALCVFVYKEKSYQGIIQNISLSGALIKLNEVIPYVSPGDECGLMLCSDPDVCPVKYICRVIRCDADHVGVQFKEIVHYE